MNNQFKNNALAFLVTILVYSLVVACSNQKLPAGSSTSITGKWQLTQTLNDPGDGSAKWVNATADSAQYITFLKNGTITGNAVWGATKYTVTDTTHIALIITGNTAPVTYRYSVNQNTLMLNPPCREACGLRFTRVN